MTKSVGSVPSSRTSRRTASCSGAGWTGRFGPGGFHQCGWPQINWPVRLIPLLTGEVQLAAQQLPVQNLLVYDDLKRAILQRVGRNPEQHRQCFRSLELGENGRPFMMAHQQREACCRWLLARQGGVDQIIDRVLLEQFIAR